MHNLYFSAIIMFFCALSFEEKDLHHLMWFWLKKLIFIKIWISQWYN
jgi:hypothetical protein